MMFMIPTPPTTSEMAATTNSNVPINSDVRAAAWTISVKSRILKSSSCVLGKMMPLAEQGRDLLDGHGHLLGAGGLGLNEVDARLPHRLRRVGRLARARPGDRAAWPRHTDCSRY